MPATYWNEDELAEAKADRFRERSEEMILGYEQRWVTPAAAAPATPDPTPSFVAPLSFDLSDFTPWRQAQPATAAPEPAIPEPPAQTTAQSGLSFDLADFTPWRASRP